MVLFTASRHNTFVGGTCTLPSAFIVTYQWLGDSSHDLSYFLTSVLVELLGFKQSLKSNFVATLSFRLTLVLNRVLVKNQSKN